MTAVELQKFKLGRKFTNILNGDVWTIDSVNVTDDYIWASNNQGNKARIFVDSFDAWHEFVKDEDPELPMGMDWDGNWAGVSVVKEPPRCECGADKFYGMDQGPHSDWCRKYKKDEQHG